MVRPFYRNMRLLILTIVMIMVWGFVSFQALPRQEDPELVSRIAVVQTAYPGANAERVEALVTEVIEAELSELEEIAVLSSDSRVGFSTVTVELSESILDAQPVWSKVRDELADAAISLPTGASEPELDEAFVKAYTMIASLTWQLPIEPNYAVLRRYGEELALRLRGTSGTEEVELFGDPAEEIVVEVDAPSLTAVGLSPQDLASRIQTSDAKVTAGQLRSADQNLTIEVAGELETLDQIRQVAIQTGDGQFTRLSDIAQVYRGVQQPLTDLSLVSGKPAIVAGIMMDSGMRIDVWAETVREVLADFAAQLPQGVSLDVVFDQSNYVEERISKLLGNLVLGALLVVGVTLFTMGWRSALVVGTALPITSMAVFGWMTVFGVPIHQMSVTGLIIALGLLIDNAIIAVDEIQMEMQHGHRPVDAVAKTVDYLKVPLFASTVTTVMTFLPIYLLPGAAGEFVGTIALGVIVALISSLALSLTVISALAGRVLGRSQTKAHQLLDSTQTGPIKSLQRFLLRPGSWWADGFSSPLLSRPYRQTLQWTMRWPLFAIALSLTIPMIGFIAASTLDQQFFPSGDRDQLQVEVEFAPQTAIVQTREQMLQARQVVLENPNVDEVHWFVGESAPKFYYNFTGNRRNQTQYAQAMVQLNTNQNLAELVRTLQTQLDNVLPAARVLVKQLEQGPPFDAPIELRLYGPNIAELRRLGVQARQILTSVPDVVYVRDDLTEALPKLGLTIDEEQAQQAGLNNTAIAQQLEAYLEGSVGGSVLEATENLPVRVRVANSDRADLSQIASLDLLGAGNRASTAALGEFTLVPELAKIARRNEQRVNTVQGFISAGVLPSVVQNAFEQQLAEANFEVPPGYWFEFGGEQAEQSQAQGNLLLYVPLLTLVMVIALVLSLGSFRQAGIVAVVGMGSVGMALFSLKIFGSVLGFMAIVGSMGLVGIAINDTVIVLSALNEDSLSKLGDRRAIVEVVLKATRHVITTTITTIAGFIPLIISGGLFWRPLAVAIAGGITGSSIMALYFVPAVYSLIYRSRRKKIPSHASSHVLETAV
ncbi:efflux RND transporter permease subunit [Leptolyngbya sp. Heron Island J]|uniref:efflux RND transporter permease subunit n=1 Tax=Leptolyngbya sp. Heron Island J TaxID=1385935 RepID=UPI000419E300|nr:efflux RND transporter permease subunit [Leptolyngbya sp. Heron Island J]